MSKLQDCRRCPRLAHHLAEIRARHPDYHALPVSDFGPADARLLVVGLAPGMHGANRTGRPFTGDFAGILLYETLHQFGFASRPTSLAADDGLELLDCRITNAVRCLPPANKPVGAEVSTCNSYLARDIEALPRPGLVLTLGGIAHRATLKALGEKQSAWPFGHGREHGVKPDLTVLNSYHCSRYNTQTRRLTPEMFQAVFSRARTLLEGGAH